MSCSQSAAVRSGSAVTGNWTAAYVLETTAKNASAAASDGSSEAVRARAASHEMDWSSFPPILNQTALAHWAELHARFTTVEEWQSTLDTCIAQSKAPRYDRGKGGPRDGAENRVLFRVRPLDLLLGEQQLKASQ